ncbi:hypothetical protein GGF39_000512 [Coemansia sp. RSA 1721]|nr:hypothetical protein GGF39_000512 [Coemansia sp. RSA 1721]
MQLSTGTFALAAVFATAVLGQQQQQQFPGNVGMAMANMAPMANMSPMSMRPWTMALANVNFHLDRLASMYDMSHVSTMTTGTPVMVADVYDPALNKFTPLSLSVVQAANGVYYMPVCTVDSLTSATSPDQAVAQNAPSDACQYGIQLSPVPSNAAQAVMNVVSHAFDAVRSAATPMFQAANVPMYTGGAPMYTGGAPAPGMMAQPMMAQSPVPEQMSQAPEQQQQQQQQ